MTRLDVLLSELKHKLDPATWERVVKALEYKEPIEEEHDG